MFWLNLLLVLMVPFVLGLLFLSLFPMSRDFNLFEKLALSFLCGVMFLVILMFLMGLARITLDRNFVLLGSGLVSLAAVIFLSWKRQFLFSKQEFLAGVRFKGPRLSLLESILLLLILLKVIYAFFQALIRPVVDIDAISMYSLGAKAIFYSKTFLDPYVLAAVQDKPLFAYLSQAWVVIGLQDFNDCFIKILTPVMLVCFLTVFYSILRRYFSRLLSLLFTFLLSTFPFMIYHVSTAYVDFPQTVYYAIASLYLFLFIKESEQKNDQQAYSFLWMSFVFLGFSVWVKRGGVLLAGINILVFLAYLFYHRNWKGILPGLIAFILIALPSILYGQAQIFLGMIGAMAGSVGAEAAQESDFSRTGVVFATLLKKQFLYADWHLLWALFILTLVFCFKRVYKVPLVFLLALVLLDQAALFMNFSFTGAFQWVLDGTLLDRLAMNSAPVVLYFCAEALVPCLSLYTKKHRKVIQIKI